MYISFNVFSSVYILYVNYSVPYNAKKYATICFVLIRAKVLICYSLVYCYPLSLSSSPQIWHHKWCGDSYIAMLAGRIGELEDWIFAMRHWDITLF